MADTDDDARYPPNPYSSNLHQNFASSHRPKLPVRNASYPPPIRNGFSGQEYEEEEEEEDEEEDEADEEEEENEEEEEPEEDEEEEEINGGDRVVATAVEDDNDNDNDNDDEDDDDDEDDEVSESPKKKRRLEKLGLGFEFVPRAKPLPPVPAGSGKQLSVGRNLPADWSEQATFVLLDAWGDRFVQLGRKSLRSFDWIDVAKKVSHASRCARTETQCRNRLDTLKKKYKKEKAKLSEFPNSNSKWVYFKKMDMLMMPSSSSPSPPRQQLGLPCGLDSGEYVFVNTRVYLNRSNGLDEMRDSPGDSESEDDDSEGLPPNTTTATTERSRDSGSSFRALADSIERFGEIYEKMENSKREQMVELERMRMEFHRDLEVRKREIVERAHAEIAKIRRGEDDDDDGDDDEEIEVSVGNVSG